MYQYSLDRGDEAYKRAHSSRETVMSSILGLDTPAFPSRHTCLFTVDSGRISTLFDKMRISLLLAVALARSAAAGVLWTPAVSRPDKMSDAYFDIRNELRVNIANITVKHASKPREPAVHNWDNLQPGQTSDAMPVKYAILQTRFDYWAVDWETQDGRIGCKLPGNRFNPPHYKIHNLSRDDTNTTTTLANKPGYNAPYLQLASVSGKSHEIIYLPLVEERGKG